MRHRLGLAGKAMVRAVVLGKSRKAEYLGSGKATTSSSLFAFKAPSQFKHDGDNRGPIQSNI